MSRPDVKEIRVVVFKEHGKYVGQCLELDAGAQADDVETLVDRIKVSLGMEFRKRLLEFNDAFHGFGRAPDKYFDMWEADDCLLRIVI